MKTVYRPVLHDIVETIKGERTPGEVTEILNKETVMVQWQINKLQVKEPVSYLKLIFRLKPAWEMKTGFGPRKRARPRLN